MTSGKSREEPRNDANGHEWTRTKAEAKDKGNGFRIKGRGGDTRSSRRLGERLKAFWVTAEENGNRVKGFMLTFP